MKKILRHCTILYAEDDHAIQKATVEYLKRYFKEVLVANDGREALGLYNTQQADAVMLDIDMPYIDGLNVAQKIRKKDEQIPILMMTAFTDVKKLLKATELNLCKYLVKPVKPSDFKEALLKLSEKLAHCGSDIIQLTNGYTWDKNRQILSCRTQTVELTSKEQRLLYLLVEQRQQCVSFETIMAVVWEDDFYAEISLDAVKFHVSQLRKKLPKHSIKSIYGRGFMWL